MRHRMRVPHNDTGRTVLSPNGCLLRRVEGPIARNHPSPRLFSPYFSGTRATTLMHRRAGYRAGVAGKMDAGKTDSLNSDVLTVVTKAPTSCAGQTNDETQESQPVDPNGRCRWNEWLDGVGQA